jgi:hypothetical protein
MVKTRRHEMRDELRRKFWPNEDAWTGEGELGFFQAPRTLPLLLLLMSSKTLSGRKNPSRVYIELWARHMGGGVIDMRPETEHAYAAGYTSNRGMRTWRDNMALLESTGFIKTKKIGNQQYRYVLLIHPTAVVEKLKAQKKVDGEWVTAYEARQTETKERSYAQRVKEKKDAERAARAAKVLQMKSKKPAQKATA